MAKYKNPYSKKDTINYQEKQFLDAKKDNDDNYNLSIKVFGTQDSSKQFAINKKQEKKIYDTLKNDSDDNDSYRYKNE